MSSFCLLRDPGNYVAIDWDLLTDEPGRRHWLDHFEKHFAQTRNHAQAVYGRSASDRIEAATAEFNQAIARLRADPASLPSGKLDIIELDRLREEVLTRHGLGDPFRHVKARENAAAMEMYLELVHDMHVMSSEQKWLHLVECVFAGNIFDLGAMETLDLAEGPVDFLELAERVKPRPWLVDDYDRLAAELIPSPPTPWVKAIVFVDNAGSDFVLGLMPLVRELALGGTQIVLAANEGPALNDMTIEETIDVVEALAARDRDLAALIEGGMLEAVSTGNRIPLIDLSDVSDELNEAAADADLVLLEGMGRCVESNFATEFTVSALRLAILKDLAVARRIGGGMYDCICKYTPVEADEPEQGADQAGTA
ncbi:MAG TPA: ARMT1-like domain-containing protein [Phycisphaerae bacterium]|nr:ARMT1-like domain-containing protein [Phycisphaerae bacterium]